VFIAALSLVAFVIVKQIQNYESFKNQLNLVKSDETTILNDLYNSSLNTNESQIDPKFISYDTNINGLNFYQSKFIGSRKSLAASIISKCRDKYKIVNYIYDLSKENTKNYIFMKSEPALMEYLCKTDHNFCFQPSIDSTSGNIEKIATTANKIQSEKDKINIIDSEINDLLVRMKY